MLPPHAECMPPEEVQLSECILPPVSRLPEVTLAVAEAVAASAAIYMDAAFERAACPPAVLAAVSQDANAAAHRETPLAACIKQLRYDPRRAVTAPPAVTAPNPPSPKPTPPPPPKQASKAQQPKSEPSAPPSPSPQASVPASRRSWRDYLGPPVVV